MSSDDLQKIVKKLQELQIEQAALADQLATIAALRSTGTTSAATTASTTAPTARASSRNKPPESTSVFNVGDKVRIRNPRPYQAHGGIITKIGASNITVTTRGGTKIVRAPHNLVLSDE